MTKKIKLEFQKSPILYGITIFNLLALGLLLITRDEDAQFLERATLSILILTLIVLIWYTIETRRMADIQHKTFIDSKCPLLSVNLSMGDTQKFTTAFYLVNHKAIFTIAKVFGSLKLNGEEIPISDHYNGKTPWLVQPYSQIMAPIFLPKTIMKEKFKEDITTYVAFLAENIQKKLTFSVRVEYESETGEKRENRSVNHHLEFDKRTWVLDVDA